MNAKLLTIVLSISMLGITITNVQCQQVQNKPPHEATQKPAMQLPEGKVPSSYVCFPNNRYMGKEQISVVIDGKTYYGCCMGCIGKLKTQPAQRHATDPLSGKEVDKATAYIVIKPGSSKGEVLYFESEENYRNFFKHSN